MQSVLNLTFTVNLHASFHKFLHLPNKDLTSL